MLDALAARQARLLCQATTQAGIPMHQLWLRYFSLGGNVVQIEIDAYLHQALHLPRLDRDLLDHAAHELINE